MVSERQQQQQAAAGKVAALNLAEAGLGEQAELVDDDGRERRTGTLVTASAHIITAVIGSGVLSLAWAIAQLGWVIGPVVLLAFSAITWFCSSLLADCYRAPDPVHGKRNYSYGQAVRAYLGVSKYRLCSLAQYVNLIGVTIGYTITTAISMGTWICMYKTREHQQRAMDIVLKMKQDVAKRNYGGPKSFNNKKFSGKGHFPGNRR